MIHGPSKCRARQLDIGRVVTVQLQRRKDALRHGVNIDGVGGVVKVSRGAVLPEKAGPVELIPTLYAGLKLRRPGVSADRLQGAQVESGMEVVDPFLRLISPVVPRAIRILFCSRAAGGPEGWAQEFLFARMLVHAAQKSGC